MDNISINPIKSKKVYMQIVETLINLVVDNKLEYGDKLYNEQELIKILNVSRPTLREALRVMEFLDIVTVSPRRGISINNPVESCSYLPLIYIMKFEKTNSDQIFELRRALQIDMAAVACEMREEKDLILLEHIISDIEKNIEEDYINFSQLNYDFDMQVVVSSKNRLCLKLMDTIGTVLKKQLQEFIKCYPLGKRKDILYYYIEVYKCIRARDTETVRKLTQVHINKQYELMLK